MGGRFPIGSIQEVAPRNDQVAEEVRPHRERRTRKSQAGEQGNTRRREQEEREMRTRASEWTKKAVPVAGALLLLAAGASLAVAAVPGGTLDPLSIPKYTNQVLKAPEVMPKVGTVEGGTVDYYEIAARQTLQQILPPGFPETTVWGYGPVNGDPTYPARTIEAQANRPVRVKWVNDLVGNGGNFLPHLLPIDQTLHWANPPQDCIDAAKNGSRTDCRGQSQDPYTGPVPLVTHLHGAHVGPKSDGYPEAWYLPKGPFQGFAPKGSNYDSEIPTDDGAAVFQYPNTQRATTLWYHDHALGMTRANVYTGLAGFYLLRDSLSDPAGLPKGSFEIPLAIQDKSFNSDGSLFFPGDRAFFEGLNTPPTHPFLNISFIPEIAKTGFPSDVSPIWNPEFFGNTMVVNGKTWPNLNAEQRRYRLRILNADDTRVLILKIATDPLARPGSPAVPFWQIGADGGFLPKPVKLNELLIAPAERVDVIVDFTNVPKGKLYLINEGPDEPFGGGRAPGDFAFADPDTTGQVMQITVGRRVGTDTSTPPASLTLPSRTKLPKTSIVRTVSLNEAESESVLVVSANGNVIESKATGAVPFAPVEALLGTASVVNGVITPTRMEWMEPISENPGLNTTEIWEIYDFTEDAHPIHIHQVQFEVVNRQDLAIDPTTGTATLVPGTITGPEAGETGTKDTVLVYPSKVTRVKARFDIPGLFVWHCHILSHEDNEMMRPYFVGPIPAGM
jgi:bilirubin oxidase